MTISDEKRMPDEKLMAYADGELNATERAEVEAAMAADPEVARRVQQHVSLRKQLGAAYDPTLIETVPDRLVQIVRSAPSNLSEADPAQTDSSTRRSSAKREATVTDLRRVRAARAAEAAAASRTPAEPRKPWTWFEWGAMAASVATGAIIAYLVLETPTNRLGTQSGIVVAKGDLDYALDNQLASEQPADAPVLIGVSFRSKSGNHCRTFLVKDGMPVGGLACHTNNGWRVEVLASAPVTSGPDGGFRQAGVDMPAAVLSAAESAIQGEPLDAEKEAAARERRWIQ
jgi:anti-sigma factor RsiW